MFMKKIRLLSALTALMLLLSAVPVSFATAQVPPETTAPVETTVPPQTTEPVETEPTMPAGFQGDASVAYGSRTLDAQKPLTDTDDYKGKVKAALLYDLGSDSIVFAQDIDVQLYPASLTKVMTALLTIEMQSDLDAVVTVTKEGLKGQEPGGSNVALKVDEQMSVRDLLYCLMVKSGNDAASVLAVQNSGSIEAFVEVMNQKAQELGCTGTHFMNPHGLHHDEHYTTARDMYRIVRYVQRFSQFEDLAVRYSVAVKPVSGGSQRTIVSNNSMLQPSSCSFSLP